MERDDKDELMSKYQGKVKDFTDRKIDPEVLSTIQSELKKLSSLERNSPEFNVTRYSRTPHTSQSKRRANSLSQH